MVSVMEKSDVARTINMFSKSCGSATVIRQGPEQASGQQYIGKYQNNIANCSKGRMYSETRRV